jgi:hypothetical protein
MSADSSIRNYHAAALIATCGHGRLDPEAAPGQMRNSRVLMNHELPGCRTRVVAEPSRQSVDHGDGVGSLVCGVAASAGEV